jgi:DNA-binding PadR family transcriptional regulator
MDLSKNEEILLLSIWHLKGEAYGVRIKAYIKEATGKDWNYGTLYCTLDQLVRKGMLDKKEGMPMPERGGRRKIYYTPTRAGLDALKKALEIQKSLWAGVTPMALEKGM